MGVCVCVGLISPCSAVLGVLGVVYGEVWGYTTAGVTYTNYCTELGLWIYPYTVVDTNTLYTLYYPITTGTTILV